MDTEKIRKIIHVDMDCFYAAVEMRDNPQLQGLPVAIGSNADRRGVLCTANYEARKYGVRAAMPSSKAQKLCPHLIFIPPNFQKYKQVCNTIRNIFHEYTDIVEPLSLDEAYLDVSDVLIFNNSATLMAKEIKEKILERTKLTASAGVAPNKFLAKIASDWKKPNGLFVITPDMVEDFIINLPVSKINGVGKVTTKKLNALGIRTCGDIQKMPYALLAMHFGKWGQRLYELSFGKDFTKVESERERKSLSVEHTFKEDIDIEMILTQNHFDEIFDEFKSRLEKEEKFSKQESCPRKLFVKLKFFDFKSLSVEQTYDYLRFEIFQDDQQIKSLFQELIKSAQNRRNAPIRLFGLGVRFPTNPQKASSLPQLTLEL